MFINKVFLFGNLTKSPEVKAMPSGHSVCNFGLATNRTYNNKQGEKVQDTEFHSVVAFGKLADIIGQYMRKGSGLYVEGRLQTRSWKDKDGNNRQKTEVIAESVQFGPKRQGGLQQNEESIENNNDSEITAEQPKSEDLPF